tara:strand:+ start:2346 stop:3395 length:1050 start_codon:yes stop_codon:yes gene_type:complete
MDDLNSLWETYQNSGIFNTNVKEKTKEIKTPKCSDIYISTKTKIAYLNSEIDLYKLFWLIPVIDYETPSEGVIKKQIKISSSCKEEVKVLEEKISSYKNVFCDIIQQIDNPDARKNKFKDIRKINIGINSKDLISYRKKKKGAFYNCFALIIRIFEDNKFKEIHVKVFNTGKLEIPGIQKDITLFYVLNKLVEIIQPFIPKKLHYDKKNIETVLINSNFSCNYIINRNKLFDILKYKYNLHALFDPCSYPGIQCKFYYNENKEIQDGKCNCEKKCSSKDKICKIISFMVFRTGSVLIVGHCDENILNIIYKFLRNLLVEEFLNIHVEDCILKEKKKKVKKKRRRQIVTW